VLRIDSIIPKYPPGLTPKARKMAVPNSNIVTIKRLGAKENAEKNYIHEVKSGRNKQ
jgi:hypothetical protein